jgi:hypothetical protein
MFACPMYVESALAFTPAAVISDANVCLHSCNVTRSSASERCFAPTLFGSPG